MRWLLKIIASDWTWKLYLATGSITGAALLLAPAQPSRQLLVHWWPDLLLVAALVVIGAVVGVFVAGALAPFVVGPVYEVACRLNHGPFDVGDTVEIVAGTFAGRTGTVYSRWQGSSVRVDLGEAARDSFKDVFGQHQLRRVPPNPPAGAV